MTKTYQIDLDNENYIKAIATHNQKIRIKCVAYQNGYTHSFDDSEEMLGSDIRSVIADAKEDGDRSVGIYYTSYASQTLFSIFPEIDTAIKEEYRETPAQQAFYQKYSSWIGELVYQMGSLQKRDPSLVAITKDEALNIFRSLNSNVIEISGALHLPHLNTILFESHGYCFSFVYGEKPSLTLVRDITFNIDYGFDYNTIYSGYDFAADLNNYFIAWKESNYQGNLFPISAGVNAAHTAVHDNIENDQDRSGSTAQVIPITKSYRPKEPPTFTDEQKNKFDENARHIRTDVQNLRFDERRQMYFFADAESKLSQGDSTTEEHDMALRNSI